MADDRIPERNPNDRTISKLLQEAKTIAVVGISHKAHRDSHKVARYLMQAGYQMIPVNPKYREVLGETCYPDLKSIPVPIDIVDIFRNMEAIPGVVDEAIEVQTGCVWMQLGLAHHEAAQKARQAGLEVVMDKCIKIEHARLLKSGA